LRRWDDVFLQKIALLIVAILGYIALSSFWSEPFEWRDVLTVWCRALLVFFFVVAVAECQLRGQLKRWLGRAMALAGMVAVAAAMAIYVADPPADGRLNGLGQLDTQVIAALVYGVCLIFVIDVTLTDRSPSWKVLAAGVGVVIAYAVYLSDSRNAWVSVTLGVGTLLLAHRVVSRQNFIVVVAAFGVVLGALIAALVANPATAGDILPRGASFRPDIWGEAWERILADGWLFGLGVNTSDNLTIEGREFLHPHSMYLSVTYQGGLIALGLFLALLVAIVATLLQSYQHQDAKLGLGLLALALPAYVLDGHEFVDKVGATWFLLWFPVGIALGLRWSKPAKSPLGAR